MVIIGWIHILEQDIMGWIHILELDSMGWIHILEELKVLKDGRL